MIEIFAANIHLTCATGVTDKVRMCVMCCNVYLRSRGRADGGDGIDAGTVCG
jgi:hypothetical protein